MPTNDPPTPRSHREALRVVWIMLLSLIALVPLATWKSVDEPDTPAEVVEAFLEAVRSRDLDRAYSYVGTSVPSGESAAFLHPDAISDEWEILQLRAVARSHSWETEVQVALGHPSGVAEGSFTVVDSGDGPLVDDPFQQVTFQSNSRLDLQVGERVVERSIPNGYNSSFAVQPLSYWLLPGIYNFAGSGPVALLEPNADAATITLPEPEPTPAQHEALQAAVNDYLDACVEYRVPVPPGCPFSTDGQVDSDDHERIERLEELRWTVEEYPKTTIVGGTDVYEHPALLVEFTEPGRLELAGTGSPDLDQWEQFTASCHFGGAELVVLLRGDDEVEIVPLGVPETDTCRGTT